MRSWFSHLGVAIAGGAIALGGFNLMHKPVPREAAPIVASTPTASDATPAVPTANPEVVQNLRKTSDTFVAIAKAVQPAVVNVGVVQIVKQQRARGGMPPMMNPFGDLFGNGGGGEDEDLFRRFFFGPGGGGEGGDGGGSEQRRQGLGSGMIIDAEKGYVLTNNHVIAQADEIKVTLADGRTFTAKVVGSDPQTDVGIIQIANPPKDLPTVKLGDSSKVEVGDWAIAVGNPFGLTQTVTVGIISAKGRSNVNITDYEDFFQTDAAINPGNSGGPLVSIDGEVIGMNTAIFSRSGGYQGIGFAIPSNMAKQVITSIVSGKKIERGYMGIALQDVTEEIAKQLKLANTEGALVSEVMSDTPAEKSGLKAGDVIVALGGKPVKDSHELRNEVAFTPVGTKITLTVMRDGEKKDFDVELAARPSEKLAKGTPGLTEKFGISVEAVSDELRHKYRTDAKTGVVITELDPEGLAARLGLREGDVILEINRKPVKDIDTFAATTKDLDPSQGMLVLIDRQGRRVFLALNP